MSKTTKPLDDSFFTKANVIKMNGPLTCGGLTAEEKKTIVEEFESKSIVTWPKSIGGTKGLVEQLNKIHRMTPTAAGEAEEIAKQVIILAEEQGYNMEAFKRSIATARDKAMEGYKEVDGKVVAIVDMAKFKNEMGVLMSKLKKEDIVRAVVKQSAEQDLFMMIKEMLSVEESFDLIGLLSARLLVAKDIRESIDVALAGLTILKNRAGKTSTGLVRLGGFIGLASVKGEPLLASAVKWVKNPILGEDVSDRPLVKLAAEKEEDFTKRKTNHERQFAAYKEIMTQMKGFKVNYEALDSGIKNKIKVAVLNWTVGV